MVESRIENCNLVAFAPQLSLPSFSLYTILFIFCRTWMFRYNVVVILHYTVMCNAHRTRTCTSKKKIELVDEHEHPEVVSFVFSYPKCFSPISWYLFVCCLLVPARHMHRKYMLIWKVQLQFRFFRETYFFYFQLLLSLSRCYFCKPNVHIRILQVKKFPSWNQRISRTFLFMRELKIFSQQSKIKTMWL